MKAPIIIEGARIEGGVRDNVEKSNNMTGKSGQGLWSHALAQVPTLLDLFST